MILRRKTGLSLSETCREQTFNRSIQHKSSSENFNCNLYVLQHPKEILNCNLHILLQTKESSLNHTKTTRGMPLSQRPYTREWLYFHSSLLKTSCPEAFPHRNLLLSPLVLTSPQKQQPYHSCSLRLFSLDDKALWFWGWNCPSPACS